MPFTVFSNSTTAYANEVIDNFYWIADGNRLPRGGSGMGPTDSVFDLGASTNRWKNLYCNNLYINNSIASTNIIRKVYSNSVAASTSRIAVTGLNGDVNDYIIQIEVVPSAASAIVQMYMNQSSGTTDYSGRQIGYESTIGTTFISETYSGFGAWQILEGMLNTNGSIFHGYLNAKTGSVRTLNGLVHSGGGNRAYKALHVWDDTTSTFTSFSFTISVFNAANARVDVWEVAQ